MTPIAPKKFGHIVGISREMAIDFGLVEATEDEKRWRETQAAEWKAKEEAAQPALHDALARLDALDGIERAVLDLHSPGKREPWTRCEGCDLGDDCGPPDWPCRTVCLIAEQHGISLRDFYLYDPTWTEAGL